MLVVVFVVMLVVMVVVFVVMVGWLCLQAKSIIVFQQ